jgi:hypothetical protein
MKNEKGRGKKRRRERKKKYYALIIIDYIQTRVTKMVPPGYELSYI